MSPFNTKEPLILLLGDIAAFYIALWLMLLIRYGVTPERNVWGLHFVPFSIIILVWILSFFIAGLYEKHTLIFKSRAGGAMLHAWIGNAIIAALFFYLIPYFGITPKTNLLLYILISAGLFFSWRQYIFPRFEGNRTENALLIGAGSEASELLAEVNNNKRYRLHFGATLDMSQGQTVDFQKEVLDKIASEHIEVIVTNFRNKEIEPLLTGLYNLMFSRLKFIDMNRLYEDIFDRIPLSLVGYSWFLKHIASSAQKSYDVVKRTMDIVLAGVLGAISLVVYPFVWIAIKIEDGGPLFFSQARVGQNGNLITVHKFRSLEVHNDEGGIAKEPRATRVGKVLRATRIDELPQLWNVLVGDLSMIGPRPEIPALVKLYGKEIPYYNVRHLIKPGLSGWAQLYQDAPPKFSAGIDQTRIKLSYDLYYIKNRSFLLDLKIALRTIKALLSREGV